MNILWIEDFGGRTKSLALAEELFASLVPEDKFSEYPEGTSLSTRGGSSEFTLFIRKHSKGQHEVVLVRSFNEYLEIKNSNHFDFDLIVIDIRLTDCLDGEGSVPKEYIDRKEEFHEKAGLFIYNDLIRSGLPCDHMAFMTAQGDDAKEFLEDLDNLWWPGDTNSYIKNAEGFKGFKDWLAKKSNDPYLCMRRGFLLGCQQAADIIETDADNLQFPVFIAHRKLNDKTVPLRDFNHKDFYDYLNTLKLLLPIDKNKLHDLKYRIFCRTLVHEWEVFNKWDKGENKKYPAPVEELADKKWLMHLAHILKFTRNMISHGDALISESFKEKHLAFLLIINFRCFVRLENKVYPFEQILLNLFGDKSNRAVKKDDVGKLNMKAKEYVRKLTFEFGLGEFDNFKQAINGLHTRNPDNKNDGGLSYIDFKQCLLISFFIRHSFDPSNVIEEQLKNCLYDHALGNL